MTRKHFEAIAAILANGNNAVVDENGHWQAPDILMVDLCHDFADFCETQNPNFDRKKFLTACGL